MITESINILGKFCGSRDIEQLTRSGLSDKYGIEQADVMVLFGGSILCGGDVMAEAMKNHVAKKYVIVGGAGHTTDTLREKVHAQCPEIITSKLTEAEIFNCYIKNKYGLTADELECRSTNCGNNITFLLEMLQKKHIPYQSIILCQDATMQRRMAAGLEKHAGEGLIIINYAAYQAHVSKVGGSLQYDTDIYGMWDIDRYVNLLMGEIPRLTDDENGYGPKGKNYIAHVEIPQNVRTAFDRLKKVYGNQTREANPLYADASDCKDKTEA